MKKFIAILLAAVMMVSCLSLTACGNDKGSGTILMWIPEEIVETTKEWAEKFLKENYPGWKVQVEAIGTGEATTNAIADPSACGDILNIAQDQIGRLVSAGVATPITGDHLNKAVELNDTASIEAGKIGGVLYGYPITSDNGYFMFYDKSIITNPESLEQCIADCEKADRNFYYGISNGWYQVSTFFSTGCNIFYECDADGKFVSANIDIASDKGIVALREYLEMAESPAYVDDYSANTATNIGCLVSGVWDVKAVQAQLGDNYAACKLPKFTGSDGKEYQMSGFGGFKYFAVKTQTDAKKLAACQALVEYLETKAPALDRFTKAAWGPSNKEAQQDPMIKNDIALSALAEQLQFDVAQAQYPNEFWSYAGSVGQDITANKVITNKNTDAELMDYLQKYQDELKSYAK